ncbi:DUF3106 domain-containing protein, partial [Lysobacter xanthus]
MRPDPRWMLAALVVAAGFAAAAPALPDDFGDVATLLPAARRAAIAAQAQAFAGWPAAARDAFAARAAEWDRLPPAERAERRAEWSAWRRLPSNEQAQVRAAA